MPELKSFTCCLIGSDTLLSQCGETLLSAGHSILNVITESDQIEAWARSHDIPVVSATSNYVDVLQSCDYDYLFAITHLAIIPDEVLGTPNKGAMNFHDGPLPEYAGLNTPMWALMNGVSEYGITWHMMAPGIDEGDILLREPVKITADDTAVSLNTKCFTAALESFARLLDLICSDALQPQVQDLSKRTYFARADRPQNLCLLDWRESASKLNDIVRALNTGRYENLLGAPKFCIGDHAYILDSASVRTDLERAEPGEVLEVTSDSAVVACGSNALEIKRVNTLRGNEARLDSLNILVGDNLMNSLLTDSSLAEITQRTAKAEPYWVKQLIRAEALSLPYRAASGKTAADDRLAHHKLNIPTSLQNVGAEFLGAAFTSFLARVTGDQQVTIAIEGGDLSRESSDHAPLFSDFGILNTAVDQTLPAQQVIEAVSTEIRKTLARTPWLKDLVARQPKLKTNELYSDQTPLPVALSFNQQPSHPSAELTLCLGSIDNVQLSYMPGAYSADDIQKMASHFENWLAAIGDQPQRAGCDLDLLSSRERQHLVYELNQTEVEYDNTLLMQSSFEALAQSTPDAIAVVANGESLSYAELNARADKVANWLLATGVQTDSLVGVHVPRSTELLVATIGVLKAGAAYVPLDPAFPSDRIAFMINDSAMPVVITHSSIEQELPAMQATQLCIDKLDAQAPAGGELPNNLRADQLAYVIYTSGSTGQPKGVMLEHRNVVNFFTAMDRVVPGADGDNRTWLAVTSLSFDISVLELFWTLNRGFKVVIYDESSTRANPALGDQKVTRALDMGLFMWGNDDAPGPAKYRLLLEGSKYFDENGFSAVWTPERHFHAFGGPYPNPAVTGAAVAATTNNVTIRAGSCVVPLHHPIRIAEEWGVVDNLSNGRVELAAASGWNPNDFVLRPENHADNKRVMFDQLEQVQKLWRGEKVAFDGPMGPVEVESLPRPVQKELTCWITTAGNPESWIEAGRLGMNVLTHLLGQTLDEVREKAHLYRNARKEAGFDPDAGRVALMLHTFVGDNNQDVRELVREPMKDYLGSSMKLAMDYAWSFPAFKRPGGNVSKPEDIDLKSLNDDEVDTILNFAFERYFESSGLFGDEQTCLNMLARCDAAGVDEIACLMDFGVDTQTVIDSFPRLKSLRDRMVEQADDADTKAPVTFAELVKTHDVTHLQCTPSTARMYVAEHETRQALSTIEHLLLGGEALPVVLADELLQMRSGTLTNMYGPTETTIWSMCSLVTSIEKGISIGTPIANTQIYILDNYRRPVPAGVAGELFIAGDGVARGYLNRPELTSERFVQNPFVETNGARMYATGDLAAYREDGSLDYLGRTDFQVKVRGYRIELGEIEKRIEADNNIAEAAVIVRTEQADDQRLVAYLTAAHGNTMDSAEMRALLRQTLPEYMIPNEFVVLDYMPRTANGKLDRKALASIKPAAARKVSEEAAPQNDIEKVIAGLWCKVLKLDAVGSNENFFDLGGHSLLVVQLHNLLKEEIAQPVSLTDLYQYTTIKSFAEFLTSGADDQSVKKSVSRGEQRRALRRRRAS